METLTLHGRGSRRGRERDPQDLRPIPLTVHKSLWTAGSHAHQGTKRKWERKLTLTNVLKAHFVRHNLQQREDRQKHLEDSGVVPGVLGATKTWV